MPKTIRHEMFEDQLNNMQKKGLEVTINNPYLILQDPDYTEIRFVAVVEGRDNRKGCIKPKS